jgi:hypothetical protein
LIRRFSKIMGKQKFFKGDKKDKFRSKTKRVCYNCGKYGHYGAVLFMDNLANFYLTFCA